MSLEVTFRLCVLYPSQTGHIMRILSSLNSHRMRITFPVRVGKLACPRVNDDQKTVVDDQKLNSGRPHDYWIFE